MHLVIDGYGADPHKVADQELVRTLLERVPLTIGTAEMVPPMLAVIRALGPATGAFPALCSSPRCRRT